MTEHDHTQPVATGLGEREIGRPWLDMAIAPRDHVIDLRAERWIAAHERMRVEVFLRCKWCVGGSVHRPSPYWQRLPSGWTPTHWRETEPTPDREVP